MRKSFLYGVDEDVLVGEISAGIRMMVAVWTP